jgi:hypothetical protein
MRFTRPGVSLSSLDFRLVANLGTDHCGICQSAAGLNKKLTKCKKR